MNYQIALTFEDGVTRFINCGPDETVADASYRAGINVPLDCNEGACGTCKAFCESGRYDLGDYIDDALTEQDAARGYVLTCQTTPQSDCVIQLPATSDVAKTSVSSYVGEVTAIDELSDTTTQFSIKLNDRGALNFLPGQYANIMVPGTNQTRSYSFSSGPRADTVGFLLRNTPTGALPSYLRERAQTGDRIEFNGPLGSFYLREIKRPVLFLAGGTGIAPFLSMLEKLSGNDGGEPVHLIFGVTNDADLVKIDELESHAKRLSTFSFACCVADESSSYPNKGYVTRYIQPDHLNGGDVDVYLCGPPPMVDAVRKHLADQGVTPMNFYYEKFSNTGVVSEIGHLSLTVRDSDEAFDARMTIELAAAQLTVGRLTPGQLAEYRRLAEETGLPLKDGHLTDIAAFRKANAAFHTFPIQATGDATLIGAYGRLPVQEYIAQALSPSTDLSAIVQDHLDLVAAYERANLEAARAVILAHHEHAKASMRSVIEQAAKRT